MASSLALWCLFLLASSPVAFTIFSGSPPDSAPLLRFKAQISRDPTGILISWTSLTNPCQWTGVSCNSVNRVVALQLHNARLAGYLPVPVIASLSMLQNLDLSQNAFLGNLSGLVERSGSCRDLKTVNLGDNALSGQIPAELLSCGLQELVLSGNNFTGNVPTVRFSGDLQVLDLSRNRLLGPITDFKGCRGLITVDLSSNALSGGIPSFQDCTALQMLNLSGNPLGGYLPEFLGNLHSLRRLYLSNNQIKGPIINKLAGICDTLEELDMSVNNLTGTIPPSLAACSHLQKLNLAENNLFGDFPTQVLSKLSSLESLVLSFNSFDGSYPIGLTSCTSLKILDLSSNKLSGSLPHEICPPGFAIEKLYLPNNEFSGSIPVAFSNCTQLKVLDLSFNNLIGPIPPDLGLMPNLETLSLWFNALTGNIPSELGQLSKLKSLVLNHNYLSGKIPAELTNCSVLQWVSLTSNLLTGSIPPEIGNMKTLSLLMLANNSLSGILPSELGNCSNLLWLDLNTNGLTGPIPPRLGRLASGPPETRTVEGISFAFVRNLASSCKGIGIGTLIEIHGIPESALWKRSLSQLCKSTRLYKGDSLNDNPDFGTIQVIDLSYNQLEGNIPPEMGHFHALTMLDLAHNKLTGTIPPTFSLLRNLGVLDLSNNNLEGNLSPLGSCSFLVQIDVSNNNFSGQIPSTGQLSTAPASGYANNPNLCGEPLPHCGWPSPNGSSQQPTSCHGSCMHNGLAVLSWANSVMLGILICIVCICALIAWIMLKRVRNKKKDCDLLTSLQSSRNGTSSSWNLSGEKEPLSINVATFERPLRKLTFSQLIEATNGFSPESLIGSGGFGEVYKAELRDGSVVAIKKLLQFSFQGNREFVAEMETLGKIKHRNLVPLLGYCKVGEERLLVYEYMHGGSLDEVLHGTRKGTETLSWDQRKQIAKGAARGLAFLHHNCIPHIIHRDMKSSNVLLDKDMEARVSDFGMARLINALDTHLSVSTLAGTPGYVPPEYYQSFRCTTKGDVYSFGVVLLELLTGKRPTDKEEFEDSNLIGWVKKHVNENRSMEVLDSQLRGTGVEHEMLQYLKIACQSLEDHPAARPNMLQVVAMLKELVLEED